MKKFLKQSLNLILWVLFTLFMFTNSARLVSSPNDSAVIIGILYAVVWLVITCLWYSLFKKN